MVAAHSPLPPTVNNPPRATTLREYFGLLRAHRVLIGATALLAAVVALGLSLIQQPSYLAQASLDFQGQSQALGLVGTPSGSPATAEQKAAQGADTILRPQLLSSVKRHLGTRKSVPELTSDLTATPNSASGLVEIGARSSDPRFAARLANQVAQDAAATETSAARANYSAAARRLQARFNAEKGSRDTGTKAIFAERISQLEALAAVARPLEVAAVAAVPSSPTSPKPVRNGIVGGILGLLLGLLLAFVRQSLDRRLKSSEDVHRELGSDVIGHVPDMAMGHAGALTANRDPLEEKDLEPFRVLRRNLDFLEGARSLKTIAVTSALPEEGKSTVAASLAATVAAAGRRTLLIECDLRRPSLAPRLGLDPKVGLTSYLAGDASPDEVLQFVDLPSPPSSVNGSGSVSENPGVHRLACIVAGRPTPQPGEMLGSPQFEEFLSQVSEVYDNIIVDTSPLLSVADTLEVLPLVDAVLLCVRSNQTTRDQAKAAKAALEHLPSKPTGLVVTGVRHGDEGSYGYYSYGYPVSGAQLA